ncbi:uncharacterized protein I206_102470 [Kwoniella pini CBS 10737]|uniref:Uncharacterized protein n=1 Tax=Kwoniella pini CBS 10737 TaxID=1296096 RepID=A0A1B9I5G6_9TREE|nr:uncharacterized protein I206_02821 [Kwoniella pini CBS 10737]OCF50765.1 hypothetical protein I206_02821 [Kwoniella pini CBS 10737]
MAIVEDVTAEDEVTQVEEQSAGDLISELEKLTAQLQVPTELVPGFMAALDQNALDHYRLKALGILHDIRGKVNSPKWEEVDSEVQFKVMENVIRLNGDDPWSSVDIRSIIQDLLPKLDHSIPLLILPKLKPYFASHPSLSSNFRALSRPIGGKDSTIDLHDIQPFKDPNSWGIINLLSFSLEQLNSIEIEKNIGLILPPTLILMDDWEPLWRLKGTKILEKWINKLNKEIMKLMGIDKLLINSLIHTISLQSNPPLKGILEITIKLIQKCNENYSKEMIDFYSEIIEKGIIQGWIYAPSGLEGRSILIHINEMLLVFCDLMGTGIIRWLKNIIPNLLQPLQYPPTQVVLPHYQSNLSTLLYIMKKIRKTERVERWRGQILNILCRLWVQLKERRGILSLEEEEEEDENDKNLNEEIRSLIKSIFQELENQIPSIKQDEFNKLLQLSPNLFNDFISNNLNLTI